MATLQNNYGMQVLVCTVNSDSKIHNTKSKQVNCRKCDWHLHGEATLTTGECVCCSVLVEILNIKSNTALAGKSNTGTKCASYLNIDSPYKA